MNELLSVLLFLCVSLGLSAQNSFSGSVTDIKRQPLAGAQVLLLANDSLYAGALTDKDGRFTLRNLRAGDYGLRISFPGYTTYEESRRHIEGRMRFPFVLDKELSGRLGEVQVLGSRSNAVRRTATGQVFYLSEKAKESGNPFRALKEIPKLEVNEAQESVTMADGSNLLVLVNGERINSGIAPIDPADIESVEVQDVVGARYLRSGARHILNIRLKKKRTPYRFFETAVRHDFPLRHDMGVVYFEVGNADYSLYGRAVGDLTYHDDAVTGGWQRDEAYFKQSSGKTRTNHQNQLAELLFKWRLGSKDFLAAHLYETYQWKHERTAGDGLYRTTGTQPFTSVSRDRDHSDVWT
ncbi:MAG: TonB-dependent receptor, partial [Tannerella sp.]|nr:TonB-dependent receptor [Tannerella sp.]